MFIHWHELKRCDATFTTLTVSMWLHRNVESLVSKKKKQNKNKRYLLYCGISDRCHTFVWISMISLCSRRSVNQIFLMVVLDSFIREKKFHLHVIKNFLEGKKGLNVPVWDYLRSTFLWRLYTAITKVF